MNVEKRKMLPTKNEITQIVTVLGGLVAIGAGLFLGFAVCFSSSCGQPLELTLIGFPLIIYLLIVIVVFRNERVRKLLNLKKNINPIRTLTWLVLLGALAFAAFVTL